MELLSERLTVDADDVADGYLALARLQQARREHATAQTTLAAFTTLAQRRGFVPPPGHARGGGASPVRTC